MLTSNVWLAPARMWLSPPFPFIAFWGGVDKRLEWSVVVRHQLKAAMVTNKWNRSFFFLFFFIQRGLANHNNRHLRIHTLEERDSGHVS